MFYLHSKRSLHLSQGHVKLLLFSKTIYNTLITGTVLLEQPGVKCFAQGHNGSG